MKHDVSVPSVGESVSQGVLASWLRKEGEWVEQGEDLFELETDKASMAVPSPASGVLTVQAQEGDEISVGQVVATLDDEAKPSAGGKSGAGPERPERLRKRRIGPARHPGRETGSPAGPHRRRRHLRSPLSLPPARVRPRRSGNPPPPCSPRRCAGSWRRTP